MNRAVGVFLVVVLASSSGCATRTTVQRFDRVAVESHPPGAFVQVHDRGVVHRLGPAPLAVELPYAVERHEFDPAAWAIPGFGLLIAGGGAGWLAGADGLEMFPGLTLMLVGVLFTVPAVVACAVGQGLDGTESVVDGRDVLFRADLDGYDSAERTPPVPESGWAVTNRSVVLRLEPLRSEPPATPPSDRAE